MREPLGFLSDSAIPRNVSASCTVSKACVYEDATDAAAGAKGSLGALFWMSSAI